MVHSVITEAHVQQHQQALPLPPLRYQVGAVRQVPVLVKVEARLMPELTVQQLTEVVRNHIQYIYIATLMEI